MYDSMEMEVYLVFGKGFQANGDNISGSTGHIAADKAAPVQFPLKLMRISPIAPFFHKANLLLAADCAAYSYARFREAYGAKHTLVIGCPDAYGKSFTDKLVKVLSLNDILSVTLVRTDAECCQRMKDAVMSAIRLSCKDIPLSISTVFIEGEVVE
jgi:hypothetical protein